jgi:hypothetical protein
MVVIDAQGTGRVVLMTRRFGFTCVDYAPQLLRSSDAISYFR